MPDDQSRRWGVVDAVAAGPALISRGKVKITDHEEVFFGSTIPDVHPRTAAGITRDGRLILLVVDGRQIESSGVDLEDLASILLDLGAYEALNLDGGGSSTVVVDGVRLNSPSGSAEEREVMSAIALTCSP
jgi:exopolysaccharide biosynthesis protein